MSDLIQIPWQPVYWLRPEMVAKLREAGDRLGTNLMLYTADSRGLLSAWRSYAQQNTLWVASQHGGNSASRPDSGPRSHMRGTAADIVRTDAAAQNACRAVGLGRDPVESWHWNLPGYLNYPIIPTNTSAAGGGAVLIEGSNMSFAVCNSVPADGYTLIGDAGVATGITLATVNLLQERGLLVQKTTRTLSATERTNLLAQLPVLGEVEVTLSDAEIAEIAVAIDQGDNADVLAAIRGLDTQADTYQAQVLAALATVDEATLATFGLKRA